VTYTQLIDVLRSDFNRADKEPLYPIWINRALRMIQDDGAWSFDRQYADVTITSGSSSAELPENFKELTAEKSPISVFNPDGDSPFTYIPVEIVSREFLERYRSSSVVPVTPIPLRAQREGLRVFVENPMGDSSRWTINMISPAAGDFQFRVYYLGYLPTLTEGGTTKSNRLTIEYPELVIAQMKAIAFAAVNDPIAGDFQALYRDLHRQASLSDWRRRNKGRVFRMGG
jgi:hypothetical protein